MHSNRNISESEHGLAHDIPSSLTNISMDVSEREVTKDKWHPTNFKVLFMIGCDCYSRTILAESLHASDKGRLYAMKVVRQGMTAETDDLDKIQTERHVLQHATSHHHPFIARIHGLCQTPTTCIFFMEYYQGGELMLHWQRGEFSLERSRFYLAEMVLALKWLHNNNILYRDVKLDTVLLDEEGHIRLSGFFFSKLNMLPGSETSSFTGTMEFMAPEMLLGNDYGTSVDWWSFGVIAYQLLLRQSPCKSEDADEIYDAILADDIPIPEHLPDAIIDLLRKLLARNPDKRLGSGTNGVADVMNHPFFESVNWDDMYHKRLSPPWKPVVDSPTDVRYFDDEFVSQSTDIFSRP